MSIAVPAANPPRDGPRPPLVRWLLLLLMLIAFARVVWRLDAKDLWWDESLSLQRAESDWQSVLTGRIVLTDGINQLPTTDQHPFTYFVLLGILVRLAGTSEFALRLPSAMAAALLVPMAWTLARRMARGRLLPGTTPQWAALLAAASPFYLWYGQEARMYTLVALLALASTYWLLRWAGARGRAQQWRCAAPYAMTTLALLTAHYLSVLIVPPQLLLVLVRVVGRSRRRAILAAGVLVAAGLAAVAGLWVAERWLVPNAMWGGSNFPVVSLGIMAPDLVNAFSLGLSVNIDDVRWLDAASAALALAGLGWGLWRWRGRSGYGWLLPLVVATPVLGIQVVQRVQPVYIDARHLSLISGAYLVAVAGGLAWAWQWRRWIATALAGLLLGGMAYSTANSSTLAMYSKDDFREAGAYLQQHLQPGDLVLLNPSEMWRLYQYYLPVWETPTDGGQGVDTQGVPLLTDRWADTANRLEALANQHRRVWLVDSGMVPLNQLQVPARAWPLDHLFRVSKESFHSSNSFLEVSLFLPRAPVASRLPKGIQYPENTTFGGQVKLVGYDLGQPLRPGAATPVTLYWQAAAPVARHYKYILRLAERDAGGSWQRIASTEREPYDGAAPTTSWIPGATLIEYSEVPPAVLGGPADAYRLTLQVYDAETLQKLTVADPDGQSDAADQSLVLPYVP